ncbi:hypothetical protein Glove_54g84 [Diversispora epigaea]|uniref:MULE transposase domain-containing protein n=1 Tax=Diversispora epigaea TaxID=1348612 RepID=A0A397JG70_9GLOM|nr:hypothetical protein Glove_54g84 [Diversispora epigaea]
MRSFTYTLIESDQLKHSEAVRTLVIQETIKNYPPAAIVKAIKEYANNELQLSKSIKDLKRREVANIKYKLKGPMETHLVGNVELESDILETILYLKNQDYYCECYYVLQKSTNGIVFIHPEQLKKLCLHGSLWLLGCWDVGAHFFVSTEDSDTIAEVLKIIRNICKNWIPAYILMDQSNIEANSIKKVFPGLKANEQECNIIFCTVHIMRTWMSKIYKKKTKEVMIGVMYKRTKIRCEQLIQNALQLCPVPAIFISTNALKSFHSELKKTISFLHGLIGVSHKIVIIDQKKRADSENTAFNFCTKKISACAVIGRIKKGKCVPGLISMECHCLFYNRYLLLCKHIFHEHMYGSLLLTKNAWRKFQELFEESGFEIYEKRELVFVEIPAQIEEEKQVENR